MSWRPSGSARPGFQRRDRGGTLHCSPGTVKTYVSLDSDQARPAGSGSGGRAGALDRLRFRWRTPPLVEELRDSFLDADLEFLAARQRVMSESFPSAGDDLVRHVDRLRQSPEALAVDQGGPGPVLPMDTDNLIAATCSQCQGVRRQTSLPSSNGSGWGISDTRSSKPM